MTALDPLALTALFALVVSYAIGSIPFAYIIVRLVTGEDITTHGTGNVGAMNVRRSTGSWGWFVVAMVADALKGLLPVLAAKMAVAGASVSAFVPASVLYGSQSTSASDPWFLLVPQAAILGAVLGHNYSIWLALVKHRFSRTGKGLATGAGALLAYDWRYFLVVVAVGLTTIAVTRYMMAGQVAAAASLPLAALALGSPDWLFMTLMAAIVIVAHWKRFVGMLQGREPKLYINDRMGPRG